MLVGPVIDLCNVAISCHNLKGQRSLSHQLKCRQLVFDGDRSESIEPTSKLIGNGCPVQGRNDLRRTQSAGEFEIPPINL